MKLRIVHFFARAILFMVSLELFFFLGGIGYQYYYAWSNQLIKGTADEYRVLCIGESFTMTPLNSSYPIQLQEILDEFHLPKKVKVIPGGAPGISSSYVVDHLNENLKKYKPHLVIIMIGVLDGSFSNLFENNLFTNIRFLVLGQSKVIRLVKMTTKNVLAMPIHSFSLKIKNAEAAEDDFVNSPNNPATNLILDSHDFLSQKVIPDEYEKIRALLFPHPLAIRNFRDMIGKVRQANARLIIMQYPRIPIEPLIKKIRPQNGVTFLENVENFEEAIKKEGLQTLFTDAAGKPIFGHFTARGARLVAENLVPVILQDIKSC